MLSKAEIKRVSSYKEAKYRNQDMVFVVEGVKMVDELIASGFEIERIFGTRKWMDDNTQKVGSRADEVIEVGEDELKKISSLITPNQVLAIVKAPTPKDIDFKDRLVIALDQINDPGNLGTIIRIADWFGVEDIICSESTVDQYNPKAIQSTMGSLFRVNISYVNLEATLKTLSKTYPIYGTVVKNGEDIYQTQLKTQGIIIIGSESHGISKEILPLINHPLTIPNFSINQSAESLNASIATGIVLSEFRRRG
mgnify:FL=1